MVVLFDPMPNFVGKFRNEKSNNLLMDRPAGGGAGLNLTRGTSHGLEVSSIGLSRLTHETWHGLGSIQLEFRQGVALHVS